MTLSTRQQRKIQIAVVGGITLLFVLIVVLAFLIAIRANHNRQEQQLLETRAQITYQLNQAQTDIDFFQSMRFAEEYAMIVLRWGRPGQTLFTR